MDLEVDPQRPSAARIYDYYLGGTHNFAADRQTAAAALAVMPELPEAMRVNRAFLRRAVTTAAEAGVDQFLDLGSGIPTEGNVHEVARRINPRARVVYVDVEPVAVAHGTRLLTGDPDAEVLRADLTDAETVLAADPVRRLLDLARPVCLLLVAVAHFLPDSERLNRALERYRDALAPGSSLVVSHGSDEGDPEKARQVRLVYNNTTSPMVLRDRAEIAALFGDWPLIEPGVTPACYWRPEPDTPAPSAIVAGSFVAGVARKPE